MTGQVVMGRLRILGFGRLVLLEPEPPLHVVPEQVVRERDVLLLLVEHDSVVVAAPKSTNVPLKSDIKAINIERHVSKIILKKICKPPRGAAFVEHPA